MAKRYLGYGYTNAQGVAKLEYDPSGNALSHSYTGVGAGQMQIVAESGTLQSETFNVYDCFIVDTGVTGTYNQYASDNANTNAQVFDDGTLLSIIDTTQGNARRIFNNENIGGSDTNDITGSFCLEFDIVNISGRVGFNFYQTTGDSINTLDNNTLTITGACHFKIVHDGTKYSVWIDNTKKVNDVAHVWNTGRFMMLLYATDTSSIKYKNFKVYQI